MITMYMHSLSLFTLEALFQKKPIAIFHSSPSPCAHTSTNKKAYVGHFLVSLTMPTSEGLRRFLYFLLPLLLKFLHDFHAGIH